MELPDLQQGPQDGRHYRRRVRPRSFLLGHRELTRAATDTLTTSSRPAPPPSTPSRSNPTGPGVPRTTGTARGNPSRSSPLAPVPPTSTRAKAAPRTWTSPSLSIQTTTNLSPSARPSRSVPPPNLRPRRERPKSSTSRSTATTTTTTFLFRLLGRNRLGPPCRMDRGVGVLGGRACRRLWRRRRRLMRGGGWRR